MNVVRLLVAALAALQIVRAQAPANDSCTSPIALVTGLNPGVFGNYTNVNATNSNPALFGVECGTAFHSDVWFTLTATKTGPVTVTTCTSTMLTMTQPVIAVYPAGVCAGGASAIACSTTYNGQIFCPQFFFVFGSLVTWNAVDGATYLIRVGTQSATGQGTFKLETTQAAATPANDVCTGATALVEGTNAGLSFAGSHLDATTFGCPAWSTPHSDVWHTFTTGPTTAEVSVSATGVDLLSVYSGSCGTGPTGLQAVSCGGAASFLAAAATTYRIRAGRAQTTVAATLTYSVTIECNPNPANDGAAGAFAFPIQPTYASLMATNVGATDDPAFTVGAACSTAPLRNGVFFDYFALSSGRVRFSTETPPGQPAGTLADTLVAVYASALGGVAAACDDDAGTGGLSVLVADVVQGAHYVVMVCSPGASAGEGTFWISAEPLFGLAMSSPAGPGSILLTNANGAPGSTVFNLLTFNQGAFPYGPIFGVDISFADVVAQLLSGAPPFSATLDAVGGYAFGPVVGLPSFTVYGVALQLDASGYFSGVSPPVSHTIP